MAETRTPEEQVRELYERAESQSAKAMEQLVSRPAFGQLLAWSTENVVAIGKIAADVGDLFVRNLRLAGRQDVNRLARQLNRTEDKLELVLQEVERLQDELEEARRSSNGRRPRKEDKAS
jgi:hypothetical protein